MASSLENLELATIQTLEWDTQILGRSCARITEFKATGKMGPSSYGTLVQELKKRGLQYVTARIDTQDWRRVQALEASGFCLVDGILEFARPVEVQVQARPSSSEPDAKKFVVQPATAADAREVGDLAAKSFSKTRFHNDPLLSPAIAERVHREWAQNSCVGKAADSVWLVRPSTGGPVGGFITCKLESANTGRIVLVAVRPDLSGRGLGGLLVNAAADWFKEQKRVGMLVQTQVDNWGAIRLYGRAGFSPVQTYFTLRWSPT